jgi:hypothetical protein
MIVGQEAREEARRTAGTGPYVAYGRLFVLWVLPAVGVEVARPSLGRLGSLFQRPSFVDFSLLDPSCLLLDLGWKARMATTNHDHDGERRQYSLKFVLYLVIFSFFLGYYVNNVSPYSFLVECRVRLCLIACWPTQALTY